MLMLQVTQKEQEIFLQFSHVTKLRISKVVEKTLDALIEEETEEYDNERKKQFEAAEASSLKEAQEAAAAHAAEVLDLKARTKRLAKSLRQVADLRGRELKDDAQRAKAASSTAVRRRLAVTRPERRTRPRAPTSATMALRPRPNPPPATRTPQTTTPKRKTPRRRRPPTRSSERRS